MWLRSREVPCMAVDVACIESGLFIPVLPESLDDVPTPVPTNVVKENLTAGLDHRGIRRVTVRSGSQHQRNTQQRETKGLVFTPTLSRNAMGGE